MSTILSNKIGVRGPMLATLLSLVPSWLACDNDERNDPETASGAGSEAAVSYDAYLARMYEADCSVRRSCCEGWDEVPFSLCVSEWEEVNDDEGRIRDTIRAGRMRFDAQAAEQCAAAIRTDTCVVDEAFFVYNSPCKRVVQPAVPAGGACVSSDECINALCTFTSEAEPEGTCTVVSDGDPCAFACRITRSGERYCIEDCPDTSYCRGNVCDPLLPIASTGESCAYPYRCDMGTWCNENQLCESLRLTGSPCNDDGACASFSCVDGQCGPYEYCF